jgi:hypothetical protein
MHGELSLSELRAIEETGSPRCRLPAEKKHISRFPRKIFVTEIDRNYTVPMKWPQEVEDEIQRLKKICRDDQDLIIDGPLSKDGGWRVYLQNAAPLVEYPQTFDEMTTYYKHLLRTGKLDRTNANARKIGHAEFLEEFCRD